MESARRSIEASVSRLAHFLSGVPSADVPNLSGWRPSATWDYALPNWQSKLYTLSAGYASVSASAPLRAEQESRGEPWVIPARAGRPYRAMRGGPVSR